MSISYVLPSSASIPNFSVVKTNSSSVFTENKVPAISLQQLHNLIGNLKQNKILDIDSWFDEDVESSMIFIFVSCIIAFLAFILLFFLCFKHDKLMKLMALYMTSPQVVNAAAVNTSCNTSNMYVYILSSICIQILTYAIIKILIHGCRYFHRYQTTMHFLCEH